MLCEHEETECLDFCSYAEGDLEQGHQDYSQQYL